jgi:hypothetical protein
LHGLDSDVPLVLLAVLDKHVGDANHIALEVPSLRRDPFACG